MAEEKKEKKVAKGASYTLAFDRIDMALEARFPIEAIAIEESIIADRLRSFLVELVPNVMNSPREISTLINFMKVYSAGREEELCTRLGEWTGKRNLAIHGIVSSGNGGDAKIPAGNFIPTAMAAAQEGKELAHKISHWVDKEKRAVKRARAKMQCDKIKMEAKDK